MPYRSWDLEKSVPTAPFISKTQIVSIHMSSAEIDVSTGIADETAARDFVITTFMASDIVSGLPCGDCGCALDLLLEACPCVPNVRYS